MNFKIGDQVLINIECFYGARIVLDKPNWLPDWYSDDIFTIIDFVPNNDKVAILDRDLTSASNRIHVSYLKYTLIEERKYKLLKIKNGKKF